MSQIKKGNPNTQLRSERIRRGWSQEDVAEQVGTSSVNVSRWERGITFPTPYYRQKLSKLFEKSPQELGFLHEEHDERVEQSAGKTVSMAEPLEKAIEASFSPPQTASNDLDKADSFPSFDDRGQPDESAKLHIHAGTRKHSMTRPLIAIGSLLLAAGIVLATAFSFPRDHAKSSPPTAKSSIVRFSTGDGEADSVAWSPDGKYVAAGSDSNKIQVWNATTGQLARTYLSFEGQVTSIAWSPNGKYIAATGESGAIQVWDATTGDAIDDFADSSEVELLIAWSPDDAFVATAGVDGKIRAWNLATDRLAYAYNTHSEYAAYTVAWSPNGEFIAAGNEGTLQIWNAATERPVFSYKNLGNQSVIGLAWSPNSQDIAFGAGDTSVQVWNVLADKLVYTYQGLGYVARAVAWSPDGRRLAAGGSYLSSATSANFVQVWDALTGQHVYTHTGQQEIMSIAWSPDSKRLASGDINGTVEIWPDR